MVNLNSFTVYLFLFSYIALYFFGPLGHILNVLAILLLIFSLVTFRIRSIYKIKDIYIIFILFLMMTLAVILNLSGSVSLSVDRTLFLYISIIGFFSVLMIFNSNETSVFKLIVFLFGFEFFTIILQFTYLYFGFGIQPKVDLGYVTTQGLSINPNNTAVLILLYYFYLTNVFIENEKLFLYYLFSLMAFIMLLLLLSRTVLIFFIFFFVLTLIYLLKNNKLINSILILLISFIGVFIFFNVNLSEYLKFDKLASINQLSSDESTSFRYISLMRLIENFNNLGMGSFSIGDYGRFYEFYDDPLLKINPHMFLSEYSFLFGYMGFFLVFGLFLLLIYSLIKNKSVNPLFKIPLICSILFIQAVPSSVLSIINFIPMLVLLVTTDYNFKNFQRK